MASNLDYQTICRGNLLRDVPGRTKDVLSRRFGLGGERETLEEIGKAYGITRERVRQIQDDGLKKLSGRSQNPECQKVFQTFAKEFKSSGSLMREDIFLAKMAGQNPKLKNYVFFLLTLGKPFQRFAEDEKFHAFWAIDKNSVARAQKTVDSFIVELKKKNTLLPLPKNISPSYVEISKKVLKTQEGSYGLKEWPEVNPRGIKDKAFIILKKEQKPLHFTEVAGLIGEGTLCQTVHNELIKDERFVLVGRGLYALKDWGYQPGIVREVIANVLKTAKKPLEKEKVINKVLEQRQVKPNTILLNLQNKKYFLRTSEGKYTIREA